MSQKRWLSTWNGGHSVMMESLMTYAQNLMSRWMNAHWTKESNCKWFYLLSKISLLVRIWNSLFCWTPKLNSIIINNSFYNMLKFVFVNLQHSYMNSYIHGIAQVFSFHFISFFEMLAATFRWRKIMWFMLHQGIHTHFWSLEILQQRVLWN